LTYRLLAPDMQYWMQGVANGATVSHLNMEDIRALPLPPMPALPMQRRIGAAIAAFDDLMENNRRRVGILEEIARLTYREWFVHFRFPGHEDVELVDSDLGPIPDRWAAAPLAEFANYINRGIAPKYDDSAESVVINQRCVRYHRLLMENARRHVKAVPPEKVVRLGDVLVNSTGVGTLGRVAPVRTELQDTTVDSHVTIVRPGAGTDIDYFAELVLSLEVAFEAMGVGSTGQTELNRTRVGETIVVVAPRDLQASFGDVARPLRRLSTNLLRQNEVLRAARDLLLPRLVSGELDVSELDLDLAGVG
jgi:type I restriction enzyme, S subunit